MYHQLPPVSLPTIRDPTTKAPDCQMSAARTHSAPSSWSSPTQLSHYKRARTIAYRPRFFDYALLSSCLNTVFQQQMLT